MRVTGPVPQDFKHLLLQAIDHHPLFISMSALLQEEEVTREALSQALSRVEASASRSTDQAFYQHILALCIAYDLGFEQGSVVQAAQNRAEQTRFEDLTASAIEDLNRWCHEHPHGDPTDGEIYEIAECATPDYDSDCLEVLVYNNHLARTIPERQPRDRSCAEIASTVIQEALEEALHERWYEIEEEREEAEEEEEEEDET